MTLRIKSRPDLEKAAKENTATIEGDTIRHEGREFREVKG
jgi:hypothetical protein